MAIHDSGFFIRNARRKMNITQEQLSRGLCEPSTLSRIERGLISPSNYLLRALLGRLGYHSDNYMSIFCDKDEYEILQSMDLLSNAFLSGNLVTAQNIILELERREEFKEKLYFQYLLIAKANLRIQTQKPHTFNESSINEYIDEVKKAISITIPNFSESQISSLMLSRNEIQAINLIAYAYYVYKDYEKSAQIIEAVKSSVEKFFMNKFEKAQIYPLILSNLAYMLYILKRYDEALKLCEDCLNYCVERTEISPLPNILEIYGYCLNKAGKVLESEKILKRAYYLADVLKQEEKVHNIHKFYKSAFNKNIDEQQSEQHTVQQDEQHNNHVNILVQALGNETLSTKELMLKIGITRRQTFRDSYLIPAISMGFIEMTIPNNPNDKRQRYRLTSN